MQSGLYTLAPNRNFEITQDKLELVYQDTKMTIELDSKEGITLRVESSERRKDSEPKKIKLDESTLVNGARFIIKKEDGKYLFFPQGDGFALADPKPHDFEAYQLMQSNLRGCIDSITLVSELEQDEKQIGASKREGAGVAEADTGYALAVQLYRTFNLAGLSSTEKAELEFAYKTLLSSARMARNSIQMLHTLWKDYFANQKDDLVKDYDEKQKYPYSGAMDTFVSSLTEKLLKNKILYLNYGMGPSFEKEAKGYKTISPGHHEVMKCTFDGDPNTGKGICGCIIYNAGYESEATHAAKGLVTGVREYQFTCEKKGDITRFLRLVNEREIRGDEGVSAESFKKIDKEINNYLGKVKRVNQKPKQVRGNCTTMSTRLAVEEMFTSSDTFKKFYQFIADPSRITELLANFVPEVKQPAGPVSTLVNPRIAGLQKTLLTAKAFQVTGMSDSIQNAIKRGEVDSIIQLLEKENKREQVSHLRSDDHIKKLYDIGGKQGTLLHFAIKNRSERLAEQCLMAGITGLEKDAAGYPALHLAIIAGQTNIARMIIEKQKAEILGTPANDGMTAIKLAIECDRPEIVDLLIEKGVDLSPEKNKGYVIFNLLMEKVLFSNDPEKFLAIMNKIMKSPEKNKVDPFVSDGLGQNALEIIQGKLLAEVKVEKETAQLAELLNTIVEMGLKVNKGRYVLSHQMMLGSLLPKLRLDPFKELVGLFVSTYNDSPDKGAHYTSLITAITLSNNTQQIQYLCQQKDLHDELFLMTWALLDILPEGRGKFPVSKENLAMILTKTVKDEEYRENLKKSLLKFFSEKDTNELMSNIKVKKAKSPSADKKEEDKFVVEAPPRNSDQIKVVINQVKKEQESYNQALAEQFAQRKAGYYKFGDVSRAVIKFITGLNITREDAPEILKPRSSVVQFTADAALSVVRRVSSAVPMGWFGKSGGEAKAKDSDKKEKKVDKFRTPTPPKT